MADLFGISIFRGSEHGLGRENIPA